MKKKLALSILLALLVLAMAAFPALAVDTVTPDATNGFTISKTGLTAGGQYLILALEGKYDTAAAAKANISATNIVYIDQAQANANRTVTFANFWPMRGGIHTVLLAGTGLSEPQLLCYLEYNVSSLAPNYYYVAGRFECVAAANGGQFKVTLTAADGTKHEKTSGFAGIFSFVVPEGTYTLRVDVPGYLNYTLRDIVVENGNVLLPEIKLYGGDFDDSGQVTPSDLTQLLDHFNTYPGHANYDSEYDLTNDTLVNIDDLLVLIWGFLEKDVTEVFQ